MSKKNPEEIASIYIDSLTSLRQQLNAAAVQYEQALAENGLESAALHGCSTRVQMLVDLLAVAGEDGRVPIVQQITDIRAVNSMIRPLLMNAVIETSRTPAEVAEMTANGIKDAKAARTSQIIEALGGGGIPVVEHNTAAPVGQN